MGIYGDYQYSLMMKEESAKKLAKRAKAGDSQAQYELGNFYCNATGSTQNYTRALFWYQKAAKQKHEGAKSRITNAQRLVGTEYITGNALRNMTEQDRRYAEHLQALKVIEIEGEDDVKSKRER